MEKIIISIEKLIEFKFPNIKNLIVIDSNDNGVSITFDAGEYSKKDVKCFLECYRKDVIDDLKNTYKDLLDTFVVIPQSFGIKVDKVENNQNKQ